MRTFCRESWLKEYDESEAEDIMREVQDMYAIDGKDAEGNWSIMYVRLRFVAVLKSYNK